jgi:hypothetical protein
VGGGVLEIKQINIELSPEELASVEAMVQESAAKRSVDEGQEILNVVVTGCDDDPESYDIAVHFRSPIRRIRRITGYLSDTARWSDAKRAELASREQNPHDSDLDDLRYNFR